ncbi:MAG: MATE family efflux transporter [Cellvibrionales bacterium]|nr:MATE family efflux transporter [Cellvibrionales bacterium]
MIFNQADNKKIWSIAWPMMLCSLTTPLLGLTDTFLLAHIGSGEHLSAVAIGVSVISMLYWGFGFLRMGTTSLIARNKGQQLKTGQITPEIAANILGRGLLLALVCSVLILLITPFIVRLIVEAMNASPAIAPLCIEYIQIRLFSAPAVLIGYVISGWLIGSQNTRAALAIVITANVINIGLDYVFIAELNMHSRGAAIASVIAEYAAAGLAISILIKAKALDRGLSWPHWFKLSACKELLQLNYHLFVRTLLIVFSLNFFTAQGAALGDNILAANAILLQLALLSAYIMDGFSFAAEALCGESAGRQDAHQFHRYTLQCGAWVSITAIIFSSFYLLAGEAIIHTLSNIDAINRIASDYLPWLVLMPIAGMVAYLFDGVYIGYGSVKAMHLSLWLGLLLVYLPIWWLSQAWQNHGLWLALVCFTAFRGLSLAIYYPRLLTKLDA